MTLTEFLLARIADVESGRIRYGLYAMRCDSQGSPIAPIVPDRVLAYCEAQRRIALRSDRLERASAEEPASVELTWHAQGALEAALTIAAIYADHRDYRDEWRA